MNENVTPTFGATHDPALVDSLIDDDWLWTGHIIMVSETAVSPLRYHMVVEDIRVKRKVKSNEVLRVVATCSAGGAGLVSDWYARLLVSPRL